MLIGEVFYYVLNMSIMAVLVIFVLFFLRVIAKKWFSKSMVFILWSFVIFRLLIPISIPSSFSILNFFDVTLIRNVPVKTTIPLIEENISYSFSNIIQQAESYTPITYETPTIGNLFNILGSIWITGIIIFFTVLIILWLNVNKQLCKIPCNDYNNLLAVTSNKLKVFPKIQCFYSDFLNTPIVAGIIAPKIILPYGLDDSLTKYIFLHEICHIKRQDNLWKLLFLLTACIHWFNPFVWLMVTISIRDIELACDEKVLRNIEDESRKDYAEALLSFSEKPTKLSTAFGNNKLRKRIESIIEYQRISTYMGIIMVVVWSICGIILITNSSL